MIRNSQPFPVARIRKYFLVDVYSIEDGRGNRSAICLFNHWALGSNYTSQFHSNQRQVVELGVNIMATITPKPNKKNTKTAESLQPGTHCKFSKNRSNCSVLFVVIRAFAKCVAVLECTIVSCEHRASERFIKFVHIRRNNQ